MAGIQFSYAFSSTVVFPYFSYLGTDEDQLALLAFVGPIFGFIFQPIFGSLSDQTTARFGRRRPYIIGGTALVVIGLMLFFSSAIGMDGSDGYSSTGSLFSSSYGVTSFVGYLFLNLGLNVMLSPAHAIVSDLVTVSAQNRGQVWSAFMVGVSFCLCNFLVYGLTYAVDLQPASITTLGEDADTSTLMLILSSVTLVLLVVLLFPTVIHGQEARQQICRDERRPFIFVEMYQNLKSIPKPIAMVCIVYLGSWAGYYPFQTFCSEIYGLQLGSLANACGAIGTFIYSLFLDGIVCRIGYLRAYTISQGIAAVAMIAMVGPYFAINELSNKADETVEVAFGLARLGGSARVLLGEDDEGSETADEDIAWWIQVLVCVLVGLVGINTATMNSIPFSIIGIFGGEAKGLYMGILNCCCVIAQALGILTNFVWTYSFANASGENADTLTALGPIVACAIYSIIAFFLTFVLVVPSPEDLQDSEKDFSSMSELYPRAARARH